MTLYDFQCHRCGGPATSGSGDGLVDRYRCSCGASWAVPVRRAQDGQPRQRSTMTLPLEVLGRLAGSYRRLAKPSPRR